MTKNVEDIYENCRRIVEKEMQESYVKYGLDISKATRSLVDLTDEEAVKVGELFNNRFCPWTAEKGIDGRRFPYKEDFKGIMLFSNPYKINVIMRDDTKKPMIIRDFISLFSDGMINQECSTNSAGYEKIRNFLCSIGIRTFDLYQERHEKFLEERRKEIKPIF